MTTMTETGGGARILIVDDNASNVKLMSFLLTSRGFTVRSADSAESAREVIEAFAPRLIVMDVQLPGQTGYELTRLLRADASTRDIVIVAVTAYAMKGDEERALAAGCDHYLAKPIDTRTLPDVIATLLSRRQTAERPP